MSKFISKLKQKNNSVNDFIVKYSESKKRKGNFLIDIKTLDIRRKVFISLICLYRTWQNIPAFVLFSAIFILPLKKKYIYFPAKYIAELRLIFDDLSGPVNQTFIKMLQFKDRQGLIFWMLDDYVSCAEHLVNPFWYHLSDKLSALYDPITQNKYNKLNLDTNWWLENKEKFKSNDVKTSSVIAELYFLTMKYETISLIIHQSNPSLDPICVYGNTIATPIHKSSTGGGGWFISSDYDENA